MRLHFLSNLHHEFSRPSIPDTNAHLIVLGGDIDLGTQGVEWAKTLGKPVLYIIGNQEAFHRDVAQTIRDIRRCAQGSAVHILEKNALVFHGVRFLGCTMWSDFNLFGEQLASDAMAQAQLHINDFHAITHDGTLLTPHTTRTWHRESLQWLEQKLSEPFDGQTVVITHHGPHRRCVPAREASNILSASNCSHLEHLMGKAALWLFANSHTSTNATIKGTHLVANPRGYSWFTHGAANPHFLTDMVIDLGKTIHVSGSTHLMDNEQIHHLVKATPLCAIEVDHPDGSTTLEQGVYTDDFPLEVHADLYRLASRTGLQQDWEGRTFVDRQGWQALLLRTDPSA